MFITYAFILFIIILLLSVHKKTSCINDAYNNILNTNYTTPIRGIAIFIIMIQHLIFFIYLYHNSVIQFYHEKVVLFFVCIFTNIAVGFFLFLSGYGNWFSIKKYENKCLWIINKLVKLYIPVGILVLLSYILASILNLYELFPHWWTAIRNFCTLSVVMWSFWYLKVQALSYVILFIVVKYFEKYKIQALIAFFICYLIIMISLGVDSKWWFTSLCFPLGCLVAKYKDLYIEKYNKINIWVYFTLICLLIFMQFLLKQDSFVVFISLLACIIMTKMSSFCELKSKILNYLGKYSLELFLIHLTLISIIRNLKYRYISDSVTQVILILFITIVFSPILKLLSSKLLNIFNKKET